MNPKLYAALRWGALCGGVLGVLEAAAYWTAVSAPLQDMMAPIAGGLTWLDWLSLIETGLEWGAALLAGWLAGREVGSRNFGLAAGLICAAIIALLSIGYQVAAPPPLELLTGPDGSVDMVGGLVTTSLTTLWMGGLGGWLGAWVATRKQTPLS